MSGVTIIIPCYNAGSLLTKCLNSINIQASDFGVPYEVILVDDKSNDPETISIINSAQEKFQHISNFKLIRLPENKGQSFARNTAIKSAKHPLIMNLDADDELDTTWLTKGVKSYFELAIEAFDQNKELLFFLCPAQHYGAISQTIPLSKNPIADLIYSCSIRPHSIFRAHEALQIGGYPENFRKSEDIVFFRMMMNSRIKELKPVKVLSTEHPYYRYNHHFTTDRVSRSKNVSAKRVAHHMITQTPDFFNYARAMSKNTWFLHLAINTLMMDYAPNKGYWTNFKKWINHKKQLASQFTQTYKVR